MLTVLSNIRGSKAWVAKELRVNKSTITRYLSGSLASERLDRELPPLVTRLRSTKGECMGVDGKSVRERLKRLKAAQKRKQA